MARLTQTNLHLNPPELGIRCDSKVLCLQDKRVRVARDEGPRPGANRDRLRKENDRHGEAKGNVQAWDTRARVWASQGSGIVG